MMPLGLAMLSQPQIEIIVIAVVVSAACALSGVFLVLKRLSLVSDAISHSILLGIVAVFFLTHDLASPLLIVGAAATGVLTVWLIELLTRTRLIKEDAGIGLVFPVLFSIGVILISRYAGNVHLDVDAVLVGEILYAPLDRVDILGTSLPKSLVVMVPILLINIVFITLFNKELKLSTFDAGLAAALGFMPAVLHYVLVAVVSVTAVGAFDAVGSILVVALMIVPAAAAYLLTDRLSVLILLSVGIAAACAVGGYFAARALDTNIAGAMATVCGIAFALSLTFAPRRGLLAQVLRRSRQRVEFAGQLLTVHLLQHEGEPSAEYECSFDHLGEHMRWSDEFAAKVVARVVQEGYIERSGDRLELTGLGRAVADSALGKS